ncbi:MAG: phytanoyl-CoA dioxygenase family protein, partial [Gammaproteobacteria bacterium]|nr:phytanoyl-CoA dioxygenase family protein [Gammaproteobacteria bacterium]
MLSAAQVEAYDRNGYLALENVLTEAELEELRRLTDEFVEQSRKVTGNNAIFDLEPGHSAASPSLRR